MVFDVSAALNPAVPVVPRTSERLGRSRRRTPYTSDAESIQTEEFEIRFKVRGRDLLPLFLSHFLS